MQVLWAPWRMTYIAGPKDGACIFCTAADTTERRQHQVLAQLPAAVVMLNKYPYAAGHLMVAPRRHTAQLDAVPPDEYRGLMDVLQRTTTLMAEAFHPDGMNLGMNLGAAAGAGVVDHLHWHLVPRWTGDTNFMPMLADVRVMPEHLDATFERLQPLFAQLER